MRSGSCRTQAVYDREKIHRWRAIQELLLEGADFAGLGGLVGQLQERLQVTAIHFPVSTERTRVVDDALISQALGYDEAFIRMWEFYLCYCEAGFAKRVPASTGL